jgi:hypothetical protein
MFSFFGECFLREQGICDIISFPKYFSKDGKNLPQKIHLVLL